MIDNVDWYLLLVVACKVVNKASFEFWRWEQPREWYQSATRHRGRCSGTYVNWALAGWLWLADCCGLCLRFGSETCVCMMEDAVISCSRTLIDSIRHVRPLLLTTDDQR